MRLNPSGGCKSCQCSRGGLQEPPSSHRKQAPLTTWLVSSCVVPLPDGVVYLSPSRRVLLAPRPPRFVPTSEGSALSQEEEEEDPTPEPSHMLEDEDKDSMPLLTSTIDGDGSQPPVDLKSFLSGGGGEDEEDEPLIVAVEGPLNPLKGKEAHGKKVSKNANMYYDMIWYLYVDLMWCVSHFYCIQRKTNMAYPWYTGTAS